MRYRGDRDEKEQKGQNYLRQTQTEKYKTKDTPRQLARIRRETTE